MALPFPLLQSHFCLLITNVLFFSYAHITIPLECSLCHSFNLSSIHVFLYFFELTYLFPHVGHAERWDAVPSKKDKKPHQTPGSTGSSSHHYARDRAESGGAASPGRGGFRGVRGGRGGGRGGSSMGRGGFSRGGGPANGRGAGPNDGQGEGTDVGQTIPAETNGDTNTPVSETPSGPGAKGVTSNVESVSETPAVQSTTQEKSKSASIPAKVNGSQIVAPKPTPKAPAVKSWADMARLVDLTPALSWLSTVS